MASSQEHKGAELAAKAARAGRAASRISKAAVKGGIKGAAAAAAVEFLPELIRLAIGVLIATIVLSLVIYTAIPSIFFGFESSKRESFQNLSQQAKMAGGSFMSMKELAQSELDAAVTGLTEQYTAQGTQIDRIEVEGGADDEDVLWNIAVLSAMNDQEIRTDQLKNDSLLVMSRFSYQASVENGVLRVTVWKITPEEWMDRLSFNDEQREWAEALYETMEQSGALEKYAEQFALYRVNYNGDGTYTGGYLHGAGSGNEIDLSAFTDPATKNSRDLAAYAIQAWENSWGYVWGTFGGVLTRSLLDYKLTQYPEDLAPDRAYIEANYLDRRTTDCIGLIKGYGWLDGETGAICYGSNGMPDLNADAMYEAAVAAGAAHGTMDTLPEVPGVCLWKKGHAGVYIGGGYAVEAMNTRNGVVKTVVANRGWAAWYNLPYIDYEED